MLEYRVPSIDIRFAAYFDYILMAPNHYHLRGVARPAHLLDPEEGSRATSCTCLQRQLRVR